MNNHNNCQNGFINILALLVLATFIGAFIYFVVLPETNKQRGADQSALSFQKAGLFGELCQGKGTFKLKTFPLDVKNIELITPMGKVQDSHVTPTDRKSTRLNSSHMS